MESKGGQSNAIQSPEKQSSSVSWGRRIVHQNQAHTTASLNTSTVLVETAGKWEEGAVKRERHRKLPLHLKHFQIVKFLKWCLRKLWNLMHYNYILQNKIQVLQESDLHFSFPCLWNANEGWMYSPLDQRTKLNWVLLLHNNYVLYKMFVVLWAKGFLFPWAMGFITVVLVLRILCKPR